MLEIEMGIGNNNEMEKIVSMITEALGKTPDGSFNTPVTLNVRRRYEANGVPDYHLIIKIHSDSGCHNYSLLSTYDDYRETLPLERVKDDSPRRER